VKHDLMARIRESLEASFPAAAAADAGEETAS
jgi:hypothetical protein